MSRRARSPASDCSSPFATAEGLTLDVDQPRLLRAEMAAVGQGLRR